MILRVFIAIPIPTPLKDEIAKLQKYLMQDSKDRITWTSPEASHLTLKFIGEINNEWIPEIKQQLDIVCNGLKSFELSTASVGCFPTFRNPRVFYLGITPNETLFVLQNSVENFLIEMGLPLEERPFQPHLTIARIKELDPQSTLMNKFSKVEVPFLKWKVDKVHVMQSDLSPAGVKYSILETGKLTSTKTKK